MPIPVGHRPPRPGPFREAARRHPLGARRRQGALVRSRRAVALDEAVVAARPGSAAAERDLSVSLVDLGRGLAGHRRSAGRGRRARTRAGDSRSADGRGREERPGPEGRGLRPHPPGRGRRPRSATSRQPGSRSQPRAPRCPKTRPETAPRPASPKRWRGFREAEGQAASALASWREARSLRLRQVEEMVGAYAWLARVDLVKASLGLGRSLETRALRTVSASEAARAWSEAASVYDQTLGLAVSLEKEMRLVGRSARLVGDLREGRARCAAALAPARSRTVDARPLEPLVFSQDARAHAGEPASSRGHHPAPAGLERGRPPRARPAGAPRLRRAAPPCGRLPAPRAPRPHPATDGARPRGLRPLDSEHEPFKNRAQFFAMASQMMRRVLVDHARAHHARKRASGGLRVELTEGLAVAEPREVDIIALDHALQELEALDERKARLVEMRFFGGLTADEAADALGVSLATASATGPWPAPGSSGGSSRPGPPPAHPSRMRRPAMAEDRPAPAEPSWEGRRIGAYQILGEVGHGGMGTVYLAVRADEHFRSGWRSRWCAAAGRLQVVSGSARAADPGRASSTRTSRACSTAGRPRTAGPTS